MKNIFYYPDRQLHHLCKSTNCCQEGADLRQDGYGERAELSCLDGCVYGKDTYKLRTWALIALLVIGLGFLFFGLPYLMHLYECSIH